jgi:hypothetical protein
MVSGAEAGGADTWPTIPRTFNPALITYLG